MPTWYDNWNDDFNFGLDKFIIESIFEIYPQSYLKNHQKSHYKNCSKNNKPLDDYYDFPTKHHEKFYKWEMKKVDEFIMKLEKQFI